MRAVCPLSGACRSTSFLRWWPPGGTEYPAAFYRRPAEAKYIAETVAGPLHDGRVIILARKTNIENTWNTRKVKSRESRREDIF